MDVQSLREKLGLDQTEIGSGKVTLPRDKYEVVNRREGPNMTTMLMRAAEAGALDCVELVLRCGANVDAEDRNGKVAIDYSIRAKCPKVTLMLLQWDSLLPYHGEEKEAFQTLISEDEDIKKFVNEREQLHQLINNGTMESIEEYLTRNDVSHDYPRFWVNLKGVSALNTARKGKKYEAWALLKASGFAYATREEEEDLKIFETRDVVRSAIAKYFLEIKGCHRAKMLSRSKVYGTRVKEGWKDKVERFYTDIDVEEYPSDILKCVQDDLTLEIVIDFSASHIHRMYTPDTSAHCFGLTDFSQNRIYVGAKVTETFDYSDVVSNLTHELSHKAMVLVFGNGGLPYEEDDTATEKLYRSVMETVLSEERLEKCDEIIRRVANNRESKAHELIVRVPEMISKYRKRPGDGQSHMDGVERLKCQAPELLDFYTEHVAPKLKSHIESNKMANWIDPRGFLFSGKLFTDHKDERIAVKDSIESLKFSTNCQLQVLKVSNLKLGISHLMVKSREPIMFIDWSKYQSGSDFFDFALRRNFIKTLAVIWNGAEKPYFCGADTFCTKINCIARTITTLREHVILVIPTTFGVLTKGEDNKYLWNDLSAGTKGRILENTLNFGGKQRKLSDIVSSISGTQTVESMLNEVLDYKDVSYLIDHQDILIEKSSAENEKASALQSHLGCAIPRSLRMEWVGFSGEDIKCRHNDVFVVINAEATDLQKFGVGSDMIQVWDDKEMTKPCFVLNGKLNPENETTVFKGIFRKLKQSLAQGKEGGIRDFVHFCRMQDGKCNHLYSVNLSQMGEEDMFSPGSLQVTLEESRELDHGQPMIIADIPGNGKSFFVKEKARELRDSEPLLWVAVVELSAHERQFEQWKLDDFSTSEKTERILFQLIRRNMSRGEKKEQYDQSGMIEQKLFACFCQAKNKVIVFLDGFDEICPGFKKEVISFIKALRKFTQVKICLTSRPHEATDPGAELKAGVYSLVPFSKDDQFDYMSKFWNASLKSLDKVSLKNKIHDIISGLEKITSPENNDSICGIIEELQSLVNGQPEGFPEVSFEPLAKKLLDNVHSLSKDEEDFSGTPLHAYMLASVTFENSFELEKLNALHLYERFVERKIDFYVREKLEVQKQVMEDFMIWSTTEAVYKYHRNFAAIFFLGDSFFKGDEEYILTQENITLLLRVGIVTEREGSSVFVHRTFGEFLFSQWLLKEAAMEKVTRVLLEKVLLDGEFFGVCQFMDSLLKLEYEGKCGSVIGGSCKWKKSPLCRSAFLQEYEFIDAIRHCLYTVIHQGYEGILHYLAECSGEFLKDVLLRRPGPDPSSVTSSAEFNDEIYDCHVLAFIGVVLQIHMLSMTFFNHLKVLSKVLDMLGKLEMKEIFKKFLLRNGLVWIERSLRNDDFSEVKNDFHGIYGNIMTELNDIINKVILHYRSSTQGYNLTTPEYIENRLKFISSYKIRNSENHYFGIFENCYLTLLESVWNTVLNGQDHSEFLLEEVGFQKWWTFVVRNGNVDVVKRMWRFLSGKLVTTVNKIKFLWRLNDEKKTVDFTACHNVYDSDVSAYQDVYIHPCKNVCESEVPAYVWELLECEMDVNEKELLFQCFEESLKSYLDSRKGMGILSNDEMTPSVNENTEITEGSSTDHLSRLDGGESPLPYNEYKTLCQQLLLPLKSNPAVDMIEINQEEEYQIWNEFHGYKSRLEVGGLVTFVDLIQRKLQIRGTVCPGDGLKAECRVSELTIPKLLYGKGCLESSAFLIQLFLDLLSHRRPMEEEVTVTVRREDGTDVFSQPVRLDDTNTLFQFFAQSRIHLADVFLLDSVSGGEIQISVCSPSVPIVLKKLMYVEGHESSQGERLTGGCYYMFLKEELHSTPRPHFEPSFSPDGI